MEWLQAFMIAGSTIGACYWMHRENKQAADVFRLEIKHLGTEIQKEMKDFHGRLCTLEERYIQMMQRVLEGKK
jgi:hypothetical protein